MNECSYIFNISFCKLTFSSFIPSNFTFLSRIIMVSTSFFLHYFAGLSYFYSFSNCFDCLYFPHTMLRMCSPRFAVEAGGSFTDYADYLLTSGSADEHKIIVIIDFDSIQFINENVNLFVFYLMELIFMDYSSNFA